MSGMNDLKLYQRHYDLMLYALPIVNRFPASHLTPGCMTLTRR